jgi:hypothetical protein
VGKRERIEWKITRKVAERVPQTILQFTPLLDNYLDKGVGKGGRHMFYVRKVGEDNWGQWKVEREKK